MNSKNHPFSYPLPPLLKASFKKRYKRFLADCLMDQEEHTVHCANPGRMTTCLPDEGGLIYLSDHRHNKKRKLPFTWELSQNPQKEWIVVNTQFANRFVEKALQEKAFPELPNYHQIHKEVREEDSRIDFCLELENQQKMFIEVKQMTLCHDSHGSFPDAVSQRARKHIECLARLVEKGHRAAILFLASRGDLKSYSPAYEIDPKYSQSYHIAREKGVESYCYCCEVTPEKVTLKGLVPEHLREG